MYLMAAAVAALAGCAADSPFTSGNLASYPRSDAAVAGVSASTSTRDGFAKLGPGVNYIAFAKQGEDGRSPLQKNGDSDLMWRAGFRHVRLPVRWSAHAGRTASAQIDDAFLARVDSAVARLLDQGFTVVIAMMDYRQLDGEWPGWAEPSVEAGVVDLRFLAMWQQIAAHFAGRSDRLWFELYNEPHGRMTATAWNDLASRALRVVRSTNPERTVVIGPAPWNHFRALEELDLPADAHLVVTVHDYAPFRFTHQQASWAGWAMMLTSGVLCCDDRQRVQLVEPLDVAQQWAGRRDLPLWLGEFGSYAGPEWHPNDMASRAEYTRLVREAAERRGIAWAYWEFDRGCGIYDPKVKEWREPLRHALLPPR